MKTLTLTEQEVRMLQSALMTVSPTGGGSAPFTLYQKIAEQTGCHSDPDLLVRYSQTVLDEFKESQL